jgi:CheY-like chemotaxis protein
MNYIQPESKKHVLVVDDETSIRSMLSSMLKIKGYSVTSASDGNNAIKIYEKSQDRKSSSYCPIDFVISDFNMSPMNGYELFNAIKSINPEAKFYIMTADSIRFSEKIKEMEERKLSGVLEKPFTLNELDNLLNSK